MRRYLGVIVAFFSILAVSNCDDEDDRPVYLNVTGMRFANHGGNDLFAGSPIELSPDIFPLFNPPKSPVAPPCHWDFGDGNENNEFSISHTYSEPGTYTIRLTVDAGEKHYFDSTITIHPNPILPGEDGVADQGKFLFQNKSGDYKILYSAAGEWKFMTLSSDKRIINRKTIALEANLESSSMVLTKNGSLAGLDTHFWEIDSEGKVLHNWSLDFENFFTTCLTENGDGLSYVNKADGMEVVRLDPDRKITNTTIPGTKIDGFEIVHGQFQFPDKVFLTHRSMNAAANSILWTGTVTGEMISQDYLETELYRSFILPDGYLQILKGKNENNEAVYFYERFDQNDEPVPVNWSSPFDKLPVQVFYMNGFIYFFLEDMEVVKIDSNNNRVWRKRISFPKDKLRSAVVNDRQNFVLLGTHDYDLTLLQSDDKATDLIVVEIDQDGNIID